MTRSIRDDRMRVLGGVRWYASLPESFRFEVGFAALGSGGVNWMRLDVLKVAPISISQRIELVLYRLLKLRAGVEVVRVVWRKDSFLLEHFLP